MSYVLRNLVTSEYYCKDHNKIIEFDSIEKAKYFLQCFSNYATQRVFSEIMENPGLMSDIHTVLMNTEIEEKPKNCECEFVNYDDLPR